MVRVHLDYADKSYTEQALKNIGQIVSEALQRQLDEECRKAEEKD